MAIDTVEEHTLGSAGRRRMLSVVVHWAVRSVLCAAFWALTLLVVEVTDPALIHADPAARLRWVVLAGMVGAAVGPLLARPVPAWLTGQATGLRLGLGRRRQ